MPAAKLGIDTTLALQYPGSKRWSLVATASSMRCPHLEVGHAEVAIVSYEDTESGAGGGAQSVGGVPLPPGLKISGPGQVSSLVHCQHCGDYVCTFHNDGDDCMSFGFRTNRTTGETRAFANPTNIASMAGFEMGEEGQVSRLRELLSVVDGPGDVGNYGNLHDEIRQIVGAVHSAAALEILRTALPPLDSAASSPGKGFTQHHLSMFFALGRLSPAEADEWVAKWRQSPNDRIQKYVVQPWSEHRSKTTAT